MRRIARPRLAATKKTSGTARRTFAADGGYPGGTPQSMKAELWEGHSKAREGWETDAYVTMGLTAVMMVLAIFLKPDISIQTWAREEAQARLDLKAKGFDKFEFGTHYNTVKVANQEGEWDSFIRKVSFVLAFFYPSATVRLSTQRYSPAEHVLTHYSKQFI